jgi:phage repressor protein C with HTH and peptisase S24 domain
MLINYKTMAKELEGSFEINDRIDALMKALGLVPNSFAIKTGLGVTALHKVLKKQAKPGYDTLKSIINSTNVNAEWLMTGDGEMFGKESILEESKEKYTSARLRGLLSDQELIELPLIDARVAASFTDNIYGNMKHLETGKTYPVVKIPGRVYNKAYVMDIVGDSMLPNFRNGMKVIVRELASGRWSTVTGIYAISIKGGTFTLKRIVKNENNLLTLKADNPSYPEELQIEVADILAMFRVGEVVYAPPVQDL